MTKAIFLFKFSSASIGPIRKRVRGGLVDFASFCFGMHETLLNQPALLEHYQRRFQAILVDEFRIRMRSNMHGCECWQGMPAK